MQIIDIEIKTKKFNLILISLVAVVFVFVFYHTIIRLIADWSSDPNFSHGFLIPIVSIYMMWAKKEAFSGIPIKPSWIGFFIILIGMLFHITGSIGSEFFFMRISIIITIAGIIIFLFGIHVFKLCLIPILYLIFMIPIPNILWNKIAFPLQLFSAELSFHTIGFLNIPIFREGNILHLANTSLEVVDACSGIRSLTSLLAMSAAFAFLSPLGSFKKWILFLSAIPIAVVVNVIRLTVTGAMAAWVSPETAQGFLHDMSGLIIFVAALVLVYLVFIIEMKIENRKVDN
jgi:exosortase